MQFPYCPSGCSLFCTPAAPVVPVVPVVAAGISKSASRGRHHSSHHKMRRRRRKTGLTEAERVVKTIVHLPLSKKHLASLSRATMNKLKTDKTFRSSVKDILCKKINLQKLKSKCTDAEKNIQNLELEFKKKFGFYSLVQIEDLTSNAGTVDSLSTTYEWIVEGGTENEEEAEKAFDKTPAKKDLTTATVAAGVDNFFKLAVAKSLAVILGEFLVDEKLMTTAEATAAVTEVLNTFVEKIDNGEYDKAQTPSSAQKLEKEPEQTASPSPAPEDEDSGDSGDSGGGAAGV